MAAQGMTAKLIATSALRILAAVVRPAPFPPDAQVVPLIVGALALTQGHLGAWHHARDPAQRNSLAQPLPVPPFRSV